MKKDISASKMATCLLGIGLMLSGYGCTDSNCKRIRDASRYTSKKISLKLLFLSDIFLFPFVRQQITVLA